MQNALLEPVEQKEGQAGGTNWNVMYSTTFTANSFGIHYSKHIAFFCIHILIHIRH